MFIALIPAAIATVAAIVVTLRRRDRRRADATFARLGLRAEGDADAGLDRVGRIDRHRRADVDLGGLFGRETTLFRAQSTFEITPKRAWLADDLDRPGVIGAFRVHVEHRRRAFASKQSSTQLGTDLVAVRLPFVVDGEFSLEPYWTGYDPTSFGGAFDLLDKIGNTPRPVQDELFGRWYLAIDGNPGWRQIQTDVRLRALLWALRTKVAGATEEIADAERASLEAIFPGVPRTQSIEHVVIDGDLLVLIGQSGPTSVAPSDTLLEIGEAIGRTRLPMSMR